MSASASERASPSARGLHLWADGTASTQPSLQDWDQQRDKAPSAVSTRTSGSSATGQWRQQVASRRARLPSAACRRCVDTWHFPQSEHDSNATKFEITQQRSILLKNCVKSQNFFFCLQSSYPDVPAAPVDPSCFSSQNYPYYGSSSPLRQVTHRLGEEHLC